MAKEDKDLEEFFRVFGRSDETPVDDGELTSDDYDDYAGDWLDLNDDGDDEPIDIGLSRSHPWCGEEGYGCMTFIERGECLYDRCDYYDQKLQEEHDAQVRFLREYAAKHPDENENEKE